MSGESGDMAIPSAIVNRFFQLVTRRKFAEAERILKQLREKMPDTEWNRGFLQALHGMLLAQASNDQYAFLTNLDPHDREALKKYRREFLRHARNKLHAEYDRGFFSAWARYMRVLSKMGGADEGLGGKAQKRAGKAKG